jgi:acetyltransferase-like isoleucine patch superfamily enzyme
MTTNVLPDRRVEHDWYDRPIPVGVTWGDGFYTETAQIFRHIKRKEGLALQIGDHVSCYAGCSFAIGPAGVCTVGDFSLLNGAIIMCEERVVIGSHCLISWNVGIADSDFHPIEPAQRRVDAQALAPFFEGRPPRPKIATKPVLIADNVWIGMNATILKGVTIGENSVVAAGSVVTRSVPANVVVAGNPARIVKRLDPSS